MAVRATIRTWGNSLALRIPKVVSRDLGIEKNSTIEMSVDDGLLVIAPVSGRKKRLQAMLKKITPENLPDRKEPFGRSVGREAW